MGSIQHCALPAGALLEKYARSGAYTDCYSIELTRPVTQGEFIEAFYTTAVFRIERWLLAKLLSRPSTDMDVRQLAMGKASRFAVWSVERGEHDQVLLAAGRTRSWLMARCDESTGSTTRLYFGSAVVPEVRDAVPRMGLLFKPLLGFHKMYSRALLAAAHRKLLADTRTDRAD